MLIGLKLSSLVSERAFYRPEHNVRGGMGSKEIRILKIVKCKNELYQWIELTEYMRKMGSLV